MDVSCRATRILIEAAEAAGIPPARLVLGVGPPTVDLAHLTNPRRRIDWRIFAELNDRLSQLLDHDPERLRAVGRLMIRGPSFEFLQKVARRVVSLRALYVAGNRWAAPALFPGVKVTTEFVSDRLVRIRAQLAPSYRDTLAFFYVVEGNLAELPRLMGAPSASIERTEITGHSLSTELLLPPPEPFFARSRRFVRSRLRAADGGALLDDQQEEIQRGFEAIAAASEELRAVLERLPDPVVIHRDGTTVWANAALATMLGYAHANDLVGKQLLELVDESARPLLVSRMSGPADDTTLPALTEANMRRRDGTLVTVEVTPAQRVTFGGQPARLVVARDLTEHRRMQQRLMTADRLASMGLLAAGVAHEINNPLAYVLNNIEIAAREIHREQPSSATAKEALGTALEGVFRMRTIVHDLVTLSRGNSGALQPVDVRATLEATLALANAEIAGRARVVRVFEACPPAQASAARLGQVFLNLIVNAIDAMPEGLATSELRLKTTSDRSGRAVVEVSDNGAGIPPELLGRIFDPFFTTKAAGQGTGLGLAISHEIVSELGGEISVDSTVGEGTTFRIALPPARVPP